MMGRVTMVHGGMCMPVACWDVMLCKVVALLRPSYSSYALRL